MGTVVVFELTGPIAHFRKYYTNSSSLSYGFPPRTALMGTVAAVMGWERDSYYERLGVQNARFAVVIKVPVRKLMQTVNYVRTKKEDLGQMQKLGFAKGTQVPLELVLPVEPHGELRYRVYFAHREYRIQEEVAKRLRSGRIEFPVYLGLTEFIGDVRYVWEGDPLSVHLPGEEVELNSLVNTVFLKRPVFDGVTALSRERAPQSFGPNRVIEPPSSFLYEMKGRPFKAVLLCSAYCFDTPDGKETVTFMEGDLWDTCLTGMTAGVTG